MERQLTTETLKYLEILARNKHIETSVVIIILLLYVIEYF